MPKTDAQKWHIHRSRRRLREAGYVQTPSGDWVKAERDQLQAAADDEEAEK